MTHDHRTMAEVLAAEVLTLADVLKLAADVVTAAEGWYAAIADRTNPFLDDHERALIVAIDAYRTVPRS